MMVIRAESWRSGATAASFPSKAVQKAFPSAAAPVQGDTRARRDPALQDLSEHE
jgi:hypothetical protein